MRSSEVVTLVATMFLVVVGWPRRISLRQHGWVTALGLACAALVAVRLAISARFPISGGIVGDWLPCVLILVVYWQAGRFAGSLNSRLQAWLLRFDLRRVGWLLHWWARRARGWMRGSLELAYMFCYLLVPAGVVVLYWAGQRGAIDQYWLVVLSASYLCYLMVPFAQTAPPRMVDGILPPPPAGHRIRSLNWLICRRASIHLNTFPSAHVAASVAASLVLLHAVPIVGALFLVISVGIAAGAVLGRYHYLPDVVLGALVAVAVGCAAG